MSQSITIQGIYKNNKRTSVGAHNPKNNRNMNLEEFTHLFDMIDLNFTFDKVKKFKKIIAIINYQDNTKSKMELTYINRPATFDFACHLYKKVCLIPVANRHIFKHIK